MSGEKRVVRRRAPLASRRSRLGIAAVLIAAVLFTAVRVLRTWRVGAGKEHWRRHDEALVFFEAGKFAEAEARYREIVEERPADTTARFNLGLALIRQGGDRIAAGWEQIEAVAARDEGFDAAHTMLAERAIDEGRIDAAIAHLESVVATPPASAASRSMLATLLIRRGRRGDALEHLRQVVGDDRTRPLTRASAALEIARQHGRRARFHATQAGEKRLEEAAYAQALRIIDAALASDDGGDDRPALLAIRPSALLALNRAEEALGDVEVALDAVRDPRQRAALRALRAQIYWLDGNDERARAELEAALAGDAEPDAYAFLSVADLYETRGFRSQAIATLETGRARHPSDSSLRLALARALFLDGRIEAAELALSDDDDVPADDEALALIGDFRRARGDLVGARRAYEMLHTRSPRRSDVELKVYSVDAQLGLAAEEPDVDAVTRFERVARAALLVRPRSSEAMLAIGRALLLRPRPDRDTLREAREILEDAIDIDPQLFEAHIALAFAQLRLQHYEAAAFGLERVVDGLPVERPRLRLMLAEAYAGMGAGRRSFDQASRAVDGLADDVGALSMLVRAAQLAGERDAALGALQHLEIIQPHEVSHILAQAFVRMSGGEIVLAEERYAAAMRVADALSDPDERGAALRLVTQAQASAYARAGRLDTARGAFRDLVERVPGDIEARVEYGRFLAATGDRAEAERVLQEAVRVGDTDLLPRRALVELWTGGETPTPALVELVRNMRVMGGDDPVVLYAEGRLAAMQDDLRTARERLERAAAGLPDDGDVQLSLGIVLSRAGDLDAAVPALERTVALVPRSIPARDALARARFARAHELARTGQMRAARALLEDTVRDQPGALAPRRALVDVLRMTGDIALSERQVRAMLDRDPGDTLARRMLAVVLARSGRLEDAAHELLQVTSEVPDDWTSWGALSAAYLALGDSDRAEKAARRSRAAAPRDPASLAPLLQVLVDSKRAEDAARLVDAELQKAPDEPQYHVLRAMLHSAANEHEETVASATRALDLAPGLSNAVGLAVDAMRFGLGDPDRALRFARERATAAPEVTEIVFIIGTVEASRGNATGALEALRPLAESDPPHQGAVATSALLLIEASRTSDARTLLDAGQAINPENSNLHFLRAQSLLVDALASGDASVEGPTREIVLQSLRRVVELVPHHHTARNNLAFVLSSDESALPEALGHAERASAEAPGHAPYADTLGKIQIRLGRVDDAILSFERALRILAEARLQLDASMDEPTAAAEPERVARFRARLDRQEAEVRRHHEEALRQRGE